MKKIFQISGVLLLVILVNIAFYFIVYKPADDNILKKITVNSEDDSTDASLPRVNSSILGNDGKTIYFSKVVLSGSTEYTEFGIIDLTDKNNTVSMIVPGGDEITADIFKGELKLIGAKDDIIYFISPEKKLYELPVYGEGDIGGTPKLISGI